MDSPQWTMRQALFCLFGSTGLTLALSLGAYTLWSRHHHQQLTDPKYQIVAILQTGPEKEALKTSYLAELLSLSSDIPLSLYALDIKKAEQKLLASPLIAQAKLKRIPPSTLYIEYEVRKPIAWLADYCNTAIDRDGFLFPVTPFFSPKKLPEIYLGLPPFGSLEDPSGRKGGQWLTPVKNRYLNLALEILQFLEGSSWKEGLRVKRIDVSNAFATSLGGREIVLFTEEEITFKQNDQEMVCVFPKILRLAPKEYTQQLGNFFALRKNMIEDYRRQVATIPGNGRFAPRIIDLRIPQLAFIENNG
ncbi:MAG TPA: hypothetical protein VLE89_03355 [Chlamydiales bacterium]|nr:hypothetical protein [Chlamydiales bacterium]